MSREHTTQTGTMVVVDVDHNPITGDDGAPFWEMLMIDDFSGKNHFLSNFFMAEVVYEGMTYPSSEHAYQAAKTLDNQERERISQLLTPALAKKAGKHVDLRADWEQVKIPIMTEIVRDKFVRHPELKQRLLDTGDALLVEGNWWHDTFWGVCNGRGRNYLGKILMQIRDEFYEQESNDARP